MGIKCWLFGHEPLKLSVFGGTANLMTVSDNFGDLLDVKMCSWCRLLYWETANRPVHINPTLINTTMKG
jgi:hypothetical protein